MPQEYPVWFERLVEKWRTRLIPEWSVILMPTPATAEDWIESHGQSQCNYNYRRVSVWVRLRSDGGHGPREPKIYLEQTLVHELLHPLFEGVDHAYFPSLQHMGFLERQLVERAATAAREHAIEQIALHLVALEHDAGLKLVGAGRAGYAE